MHIPHSVRTVTAVILFSMFSVLTAQNAYAQLERKWPNTNWYFWSPGDTVDDVFLNSYQPKQPIPFSHKLHAGQMKMPCEYCHSAARQGPVAGVPPMNTCMGCHRIAVANRDPIKYLTDQFNKKQHLEWIKVHDLPDFVRFSHKPHVRAGVSCQECHGAVEEMDEVRQVAPLQMGWCLRCHTKMDAPKKCFTCHF